MPAITLGPARALASVDLTGLLNRAFSDHVTPTQLSCADLEATIERDDVLLDASHVAYASTEPIGVALVAVRARREGTRARLATMGVVPEHRRLGAGRALLRRVIADARLRGSRTLLLEVLAHNAPARLLYEAHGFAPRRHLLGFRIAAAPLRSRPTDGLDLRTADVRETLALFAACSAQEVAAAAPPWQADAPALARLGPPIRLYALVPAGPPGAVGYLVLGPSGPVARLTHLGIVPAWRRRGVGSAALAAALAACPGVEELYVPPLVPEASPLVPFLRALGAVPDPNQQVEMELAL